MAATPKPRLVVVFNKLPGLADAVPDRAQDDVVDAAAALEKDAKRRCPVLTGRLRDSITTVLDKPWSAYVGSDVLYAPFVEYGTRRTPAQPFLTPAAEAVRSRFAGRLKVIFDLKGVPG